MNIIDQFFIAFRTDATKVAEEDIKKLDKQLADLAAKGNQRTEEENKQQQKLRKLRTQTQADLKDQTKAVDDLNISFSKLALGGLAALEGALALGKLKDGVVNTLNYNAAVEKSAKLTNINARELSLWNDVVAEAGGNPGSQEYLNFITKLNQQYAGLGANQRIQFVNRDLGELADKIKDLNDVTPGSGYALAQKLGIGDDLYLALKNGKAALQENLDFVAKIDSTTNKGADSAFKLKQQWADVGIAFRSAYDEFTPLVKLLVALTEGFAFGLRGIGAVINSALTGSFDPIRRAYAAQSAGARKLAGVSESSPAQSTPEQESADYWRSLGYGPTQVAALLANEKAESSFQSNAVGDNGQARGIFQWHAPRRAAILAATGIDVANASHAEQLKAAAWELEQTGTATRLRNAGTPEAGAAILTGYEAPANAAAQSYLRGQSADSYYASLLGNGQNAISSAHGTAYPSANNNQKTVSIGSVTINTQAKDADGIARDFNDRLNQHFATTVSSFDDGVKY